MDIKGKTKTAYYLTLIAALLSTCYLLMLGWYNTLAADDYIFVVDVDQRGVWGYMTHMYMTWQCRFVSFLTQGLFYKLWGHSVSLIGVTVLLLITGIGAFYKCIRGLFPVQRKNESLVYAMLIHNIAAISFYEFNTFYWTCTSGYYFSLYATMLLVGVLLRKDEITLTGWITIILCSIFIAGSSELFLAILIACLGFWFLYCIFTKRGIKSVFTKPLMPLFITLLILGIGFLLQYFGPGTRVRMEAWEGETPGYLHGFSLVPFLIDSVKATALLCVHLFLTAPWYMFIFILFFFIGKSDSTIVQLLETNHITIRGATAMIVFFSLFTVELSVLSLGSLAPIRSYTFVHYAIIIYIGIVGMILGSKAKCRINIDRLYTCSIVAALLFVITMFGIEYPIVKRYNESVKSAIAYIKQADSEGKDIIRVEAVDAEYVPNAYSILRNKFKSSMSPDGQLEEVHPGFFPYYPFALATDPKDYKNSGLSEYCGIKAKIIGWSN